MPVVCVTACCEWERLPPCVNILIMFFKFHAHHVYGPWIDSSTRNLLRTASAVSIWVWVKIWYPKDCQNLWLSLDIFGTLGFQSSILTTWYVNIYIQLYTHSYHRWLFHISPIFIISRPCIILYLHVPFLDPFVAKIAACGVTFGRKLEELEAVDPVRTALVKGEIRENTHGWYNMVNKLCIDYIVILKYIE